ncbi:MAG: phosphatidylglycerol lysyltransferase domain-containing protein [Gemmatimonadota bacterium]
MWTAAALSLGSGLLNLYSVVGPGLPQRVALLERVFPLEFQHLSRFVTALSGLALVVSSVNNLIPPCRRGEATSDLMRHRLHTPNGTMDYLFVKLFLHLREQGFERCSLGMAPMAGFQESESASLEERAAHYFIHHLSFLSRFEGLQRHKGKSASRWEPRYAIIRACSTCPGWCGR